MNPRTTATILFVFELNVAACTSSPAGGSVARDRSGADPAMTAFIEKIRAVDNHAHANSVMPGDADADALPLDGIAPFELPYGFGPTTRMSWPRTRRSTSIRIRT